MSDSPWDSPSFGFQEIFTFYFIVEDLKAIVHFKYTNLLCKNCNKHLFPALNTFPFPLFYRIHDNKFSAVQPELSFSVPGTSKAKMPV